MCSETMCLQWQKGMLLQRRWKKKGLAVQLEPAKKLSASTFKCNQNAQEQACIWKALTKP